MHPLPSLPSLTELRQRAREHWRPLHVGNLIASWRLAFRHSGAATVPAPTSDTAPAHQHAPVLAQSPHTLYRHALNPHVPRNVNHVHRQEQEAAGFNTRVAVWLTKNVGTMQCAYLFAGIGIGSLVGVATNNVVLAALFGSLSSYFLQLVLLPILSVGQNVLGRHQELQAEEMFTTSQHSFHDIEQIMRHMDAQDEELLKQTTLLLRLGSAGTATAAAPPSSTAPAPAPAEAVSAPAPAVATSGAAVTRTPKKPSTKKAKA